MAGLIRTLRELFNDENPAMPAGLHHPEQACPCCNHVETAARLDRRRLIGGAGAASLALALWSHRARAAGHESEAMVLACIDPRMQEPVHTYLVSRGLIGEYSQFIFAGAAIGVVAPAFADWRKTFWDNLATSIDLHKIKKVIAIDHRDCGAARIAYGESSIATPAAETETHRKALAEWRGEVSKRQPKLQIETMLMALDGSVQVFT